MREATLYCGGIKPNRKTRGEAYVLDANLPKGTQGSVTIDVDDLRTAMLEDMPARMEDLLHIAAYVYCADQLVRRDTPTMHQRGSKWRRSFSFHVAVGDVEFWASRAVRDQLERTLSTLSEDTFEFIFSASSRMLRPSPFFGLSTPGSQSGFQPDRLILFSGGLDSFSGTLDCLSQGQRAVLLSHRSSDFIVSKQTQLIEAVSQRYPGMVFPIGMRVTLGGNRAVEPSQRTRSFLFASIGATVAYLFKMHEVTFYENGVVSANLPIAEHVLGTRATRTTHPAVLHEFGRLLSRIAGHELRPVNPYFWKTKVEVVKRIADLGHGNLIQQTFSCAAVREAQKDGRHCGSCTQCIDRRFAILAADCSRHELLDLYRIDPLRGARPTGPGMVTAESYVLTAARFATMSQTEFLSNYGQVFRIIPYLDMPSAAAAAQLYRLHVRHGQAVQEAANSALAESATVMGRLDLPDTSVLATLLAPAGPKTDFQDGAEDELSASKQIGSALRGLIDRPITFAVNAGAERVFFENGSMLMGADFRVFHALYRAFLADGGRSPADHRYLKPKELAISLRVSEESVRKIVQHIRISLSEQFSQRAAGTLAEHDVIETRKWHGYRLNPHLAHSPGLLTQPQLAAVFTTFSMTSQLDPAD